MGAGTTSGACASARPGWADTVGAGLAGFAAMMEWPDSAMRPVGATGGRVAVARAGSGRGAAGFGGAGIAAG
ncbi:hypothetical protein, partial [Paracraurococcus ruber]|uniref:hypothetical protein n=1 Tax=Paracraurococcus ruber TaxID=77675 RepID=UPI001EFFA4F2